IPSSTCCCGDRIGPSRQWTSEARVPAWSDKRKTLFWTGGKPISSRGGSGTGADRNERQRKTRRGRTGNGRCRQGKAEDEEAFHVQGSYVERRLHPDGIRRSHS